MADRLGREIKTVQAMIRIFCRGHHGQDGCRECLELMRYAERKIRRCRFGTGKPVCSGCPIHCYPQPQRLRIIEVMRYAGPRMSYRHPLLALRHFMDTLKPFAGKESTRKK